LKRAQTELAALRAELSKLERQQTRNADGQAGQATSLGEAPQLGLEYQRRLRDVKFAFAMYEMMMQQFEAAKINESREAIAVQVIDPATPPDYKYKPQRGQIVLLGLLVGFCVGMVWVLLADYMAAMKKAFEGKPVNGKSSNA
jgi:uncharacterized protein involved in exopolysaccharide biosynthesis